MDHGHLGYQSVTFDVEHDVCGVGVVFNGEAVYLPVEVADCVISNIACARSDAPVFVRVIVAVRNLRVRLSPERLMWTLERMFSFV
jgi:hypothetical protein